MLRDIFLKLRSVALVVTTCVAVLAVVLVFALRSGTPNEAAVLRHAATQVADAEDARAEAAVAIQTARMSTRAAEREADATLTRAAAARARARVAGADDVTVSLVPDAESTTVRVPAPVVERMRLDSSAVVALGTLVRWKDTVIVRQDRQLSADSLELLARSNAFSALERVKDPWCGRRCGIVLGVGGMLATAVAVEQVRKVFR